jgi:ABC-type sugar transport system ATPase subunit
MSSALKISGIRKCFGQGDNTVEVLKRIDIDVAPGEFLILVGPSGCGKSTLLNIIAGLEEPTEGSISIGDKNVVGVPPAQRDIAMVFQSYALYPTMSVAENIGFALEIRKVPKAERQARIAEVAAMLQIEHLLDRRPSQLSGGQRQRVAMGRALARNPQLFLFDEPLSNLDAKLRVEMRAEEGRASGTGQFTVAGAQLALAVPDNASQPTLLGLRPEHIRLNDAAPWRGVVNLVEPTGADTYVVVDTAAGKVTVRAAPQTQVRPGDAVGLDIQAEHVTWFDQASGLRL